jgi:hypothetical protein
MKKYVLVISVSINMVVATSYTLIHPNYNKLPDRKKIEKCSDEGRAKNPKKPLSAEQKEFNKKKNRSASVPEGKPKKIKLEDMLQGRESVHDKDTWKEGTYVEISDANLIDFKQQKGETCNCYEADKNPSDKGDIHINIGNDRSLKDKNNNYYMIVEITPSYKELHGGILDSLKNMEGGKVTIRGYLFYDDEHEKNSINYCRSCGNISTWRKTCWEIHPVTYIEKTK